MDVTINPELFESVADLRISVELSRSESYKSLKKVDKIFKASEGVWKSMPRIFEISLYTEAMFDKSGIDDDKRQELSMAQDMGMAALASVNQAFIDAVGENTVNKFKEKAQA